MRICVSLFNISEPAFDGLYQNGAGDYSPENLPATSHGVRNATPARLVVDTILHAAGGSQIQVLRTVAHGNSGVYMFPEMWNARLISLEYGRLRGVFAPNARYELHGCGVASESDILKPGTSINDARPENTVPGRFTGRADGAGLAYLRRVAAVFGVAVVGGIDVQFASQKSWKFEGNTVTVFPNGKFVMDTDETRVWDVEAREDAARRSLNRIDRTMIAEGRLLQARQALEELIRTYGGTLAARQAAERLKNRDLKPPPLQRLPDGSYAL